MSYSRMPFDLDARSTSFACLGEAFASIHVLELISYAISAETNAPRPANTGREACSLEGKNVGHALQEIFHFLEVGRRTGMLSVEDGKPAGVISFEQGAIENKRVMQSNCRLSAQEALMQWARRVDEDGNAVPRSSI